MHSATIKNLRTIKQKRNKIKIKRKGMFGNEIQFNK